MARPMRSQYRPPVVRRRHRTWMVAMTLATWGLGVWAVWLALSRFWPEYAPDGRLAWAISGMFALPGLSLALLTVRAKRAWLMLSMVPILANAMILVLPWLALRLRESGV